MTFRVSVCALAFSLTTACSPGPNGNSDVRTAVKGEPGEITSQADDGGTLISVDLPAFVKIYPKARVFNVIAKNESSDGTIEIETKDSPQKLYNWYKTQYSEFKDFEELPPKSFERMLATSPEGYLLSISTSEYGGTARASIFWTKGGS